MTQILSLDTSTQVCSVALHQEGSLVGSQSYHIKQSHSSLLPVIIKELLDNCGKELRDMDAIALSAGPGSYTGLRIGTATVKGLCFALGIPLIAIDTLDSMIAQVQPFISAAEHLLCPMIDARRMEVYCKLIDSSGEVLWDTKPLVVDETTFGDFKGHSIVLFGDGAAKLTDVMRSYQCQILKNIHPSASFMGDIALDKFSKGLFEDLAYFEPDYLKEFQAKPSTKKLF